MDWKDKVIEYVDSTRDFLLENTPPFIQELSRYGLVYAITWTLVSLILLFIGAFIIKTGIRLVKEEEAYALLIFFGAVLCIGTLIQFLVCLPDNLMCWLAPKFYIMKQMTGGRG